MMMAVTLVVAVSSSPQLDLELVFPKIEGGGGVLHIFPCFLL